MQAKRNLLTGSSTETFSLQYSDVCTNLPQLSLGHRLLEQVVEVPGVQGEYFPQFSHQTEHFSPVRVAGLLQVDLVRLSDRQACIEI